VLTDWGYQMLANWLADCGDAEAPERAIGLAPLMPPERSDHPTGHRRRLRA
jgi:para-aminobenzoate synthetase component 2